MTPVDVQALLKKKVIRNNDLYRLTDSLTGSGPLDGACLAFAKALQKVLGTGKIVVIEASTDTSDFVQAQHAVLQVGRDLFADADGLSTETKLLNRWKRNEGLKKPSLRYYKEGDLDESPSSDKIVKAIVDYLQESKMSKAESFLRLVESRIDIKLVTSLDLELRKRKN